MGGTVPGRTAQSSDLTHGTCFLRGMFRLVAEHSVRGGRCKTDGFATNTDNQPSKSDPHGICNAPQLHPYRGPSCHVTWPKRSADSKNRFHIRKDRRICQCGRLRGRVLRSRRAVHSWHIDHPGSVDTGIFHRQDARCGLPVLDWFQGAAGCMVRTFTGTRYQAGQETEDTYEGVR